MTPLGRLRKGASRNKQAGLRVLQAPSHVQTWALQPVAKAFGGCPVLRAYARPSSSTYTALGQCHWVLFLLLKKKEKKKARRESISKQKGQADLSKGRGQKSLATHGRHCGSYQSHSRLYVPPALVFPSEQCVKGTV